MNAALAIYYGTLPREKVSSSSAAGLDISEMAALKHLYDVLPEAREGGLKQSSVQAPPRAYADTVKSAVDLLGGVAPARQKLSEAQGWLNVWGLGEQDGHALAQAILENEFEEAAVRHNLR